MGTVINLIKFAFDEIHSHLIEASPQSQNHINFKIKELILLFLYLFGVHIVNIFKNLITLSITKINKKQYKY